jgi:hypothetical protein
MAGAGSVSAALLRVAKKKDVDAVAKPRHDGKGGHAIPPILVNLLNAEPWRR